MPSKPNSDRGPYDANHNVHHKAHLAFHELLGKPASDSANDDGGDPTDLLFFHCRFLLGRPSLQIILLIRILFGTSSKTSLRHKRGRHLPRRVHHPTDRCRAVPTPWRLDGSTLARASGSNTRAPELFLCLPNGPRYRLPPTP